MNRIGSFDQTGQAPPPPSASASASPTSRILSGSVGAIVYVLAFTPLEVVKIRQQESVSTSSIPVKAYLRGRGAVVLNNGLLLPKNAFPCMVAPQYHVSPTNTNICSRLFETTSRLIIPYHPPDKPGGIFSTLLSISRAEGRAGLYAGLRPTLLAAVPNTAIYFTAYDEISLRLRRHHEENSALNGNNTKQELYIPLVAGATSRLISSVTTAPLELIRTRQAGSIGSRNGIIEEFRLVLRMNGPIALYRGLGSMIMRDVPFSALYFLGLETFKGSLSKSSTLGAWGVRYYQDRGIKTPTSVEVTQAFVSGAAAGAIATIVTTPFDLVKTRRQVVQRTEGKTNGHNAVTQGTFCHMRQIVQEEGFFAGLWRGNTTRMVKVAPGCAIMISCYEFGKRFFEDLYKL